MAESSHERLTYTEARPPLLVRCAIGATAAVYVTYLALLIACDLLRVVPFGFVPQFANQVVTAVRVDAGSIAEQHGLREGDTLLRANGQSLRDPIDWQRVRVYLDAARPLALDIERDGRAWRIELPLRAGLAEWRTGPPRPGLLAFRLAQVITMGLALLVAVRRPSQPTALLGALLLASFACVSLVLPTRMFAFWEELPQPLAGALWLPYSTSAALGPLLFTFFAVFPRRAWSVAVLAAGLVPGTASIGWFLYEGYHLMRGLGEPVGLPNLRMWTFGTSLVYGLAAGGLLLSHLRASATPTDRRRTRVLLAGLGTGIVAGAALLAIYKLEEGADIFGNPILSVLALMFLAVPASFATAILRHRLFDLRLIVRQGVRYALARRLLDALLPVAAALLIAEMVLHRDEPLGQVVQSRWWWYTPAIALLLVIRRRREHWLQALDRRFFRERYDAERLLTNIVHQVSRASNVEAAVPATVRQIDEALHPEFVDVLRRDARGAYVPVVPSSRADLALPAGLATLGVLAALRKPLALSLGQTAWVRHQLPDDERALLLGRRVEVLVPISGDGAGAPPLGLVVLGPRRSEEPYNSDDLNLLATIAEGLAVLFARAGKASSGLAECRECGRCFDGGTDVCPTDGSRLSRVQGSRVLNGRYRLERRLGSGGMGAVYEALDDVLERNVAVKVIRQDLADGAPAGGFWRDIDARFRQEARAAAAFAHHNVVRVYDFGVDHDRRAFLVMELLKGETLRARLLHGGPLPPAEALAILRGLCDAMGAAHALGLVHRDLKPENVFLERHGREVIPKVLDFGLAKMLAGEWPRSAEPTHASSVGLLVGTPDYMAPEQVAGEPVGHGWDVWALTVVTYEMLTGVHPFRRTLTAAGGRGVVPDGGVLAPAGAAISARAAQWFDDALSPDRTRRPASAQELLAACERALS